MTVDLLLGLHYNVTPWDVYLACLGVCPCVCVTSSKKQTEEEGEVHNTCFPDAFFFHASLSYIACAL